VKVVLLLLLISPLVGFLFHTFKRWNLKWSALFNCSSIFISFISSVYLLIQYLIHPQAQTISIGPWLNWDGLQVYFSFMLDFLSLTMVVMVTGVSFLIHLFSVEYMKKDPRVGRYFSYLNLFVLSMLLLILSDNLLLMFVGWEGVGLCSYLLIGFWFEQREKARAGMKAFIVNRVGDAGFLIGLFLFFFLFGSLNFEAIDSQIISSQSPLLVTLTGLFLFIGAIGKSAQLPLYVWLPSAMAGPTPVSALIHAATMVTAGVYLIIRTQELWTISALHLVGIIGALTALLGAYLACRVWDIKKILAYSTMSQLGYMFLALGVGAFTSAFFHLLTHAFFKALLFLSAGSLIHGLHHEQDIRNMGSALRKKMPLTFVSFLIGGLALIGMFPLSGFFSKDEILYFSFKGGFYHLWGVALLGIVLTTFYTTKMIYYVFLRPSSSSFQNVQEGTAWMKIPLVTLSVLSVFSGLLNWPHFLPQIGIPHQWLAHNLYHKEGSHLAVNIQLEVILALISLALVISVCGISLFFLTRNKKIKILQSIFNWTGSLDLFYEKYFVESVQVSSKRLAQYFEENILQKGIRLLIQYLVYLRNFVTSLQDGRIQSYLMFMVYGFLIFIFVIIVSWS